MSMIPVAIVGGADARELRRQNRRLRRKNRRSRRVRRLERRQDRLKQQSRSHQAQRRRGDAPEASTRDSSPAPSSRPSPMERPRRGGFAPPRLQPRSWDDEPETDAPEDLQDDEAPESWEDEEESDPEDEEGVGDLRAAATKARDKVRAALPSRYGAPLMVGDLQVRAPKGERGLVIPLGEHVFLMSAWPDELVAEQGVPTLARASVQLARQHLGAPSPDRVGDVGFIAPLAALLVKKAIQIRAQKAAQAAQQPSPSPTPATAVGGCRCQRGRR